MASNQTMGSLFKNISGLYGQSVKAKTSVASISGIYLASITFIVIVENILTLNVVCRKKRMRPPDVLLGCLATTDLLTALFVFPLLIIHNIVNKWPGGLVMCYINSFASVACLKFSMLLASWIAIDRFLAIAKPFLYRSKVNMRKIILFVIGTLIYSVVVALMPVAGMATGNVGANITKWSSCVYHFPAMKAKFWSTIYVILNMMDSTFAVLVVLVSNVSVTIYFVKRKRRKRIIAPVTETPVVDSFDKPQDRSEKQTRSDLKYAHLMGIASLYFALSFVPVPVLVFLHHYGWTKMAVFTVISIQLHVGSINLLFNPLLYGLIRRHYRGAYWFIVKNPLLLCGQSTEHRFDFDAGKKNSYKRRLKFRQVGLAAVVSARLASFASSKQRREQGHKEGDAQCTQLDKPDETSTTGRRRRIISAYSLGSDYDVNRQDSLSSTFLQVPDSSNRRDSGTSYSSNTEMESLPSSPGYQVNAPVAFGSRLSSLTPCSDSGTDQLMFCGQLTHGRPSLASSTSIDFSQSQYIHGESFRFSQNKLRCGSFSSSPSDSLDQKDDNSIKKLPYQLPPILVTNAGSKPEFEGRSRSRSGRLQPLVRTTDEVHNDEQKSSSSDCNFFPTVLDKPNDGIFEYVKPAEEVFDVVSSEKKLRKKRRKRRRKKVQKINVSS